MVAPPDSHGLFVFSVSQLCANRYFCLFPLQINEVIRSQQGKEEGESCVQNISAAIDNLRALCF